MKRLQRWLFNIAAAISIAMCVFIASIWVRSYSFTEYLWRESHELPSSSSYGQGLGSDTWLLMLSRGNVTISRTFSPAAQSDDPKSVPYAIRYARKTYPVGRKTLAPAPLAHTALGFGWETGRGQWQQERTLNVLVPLWFLLMLAIAIPILRAGLFLRRRRKILAGCCVTCGYDLRATPDRCPECGAAAKGWGQNVEKAG